MATNIKPLLLNNYPDKNCRNCGANSFKHHKCNYCGTTEDNITVRQICNNGEIVKQSQFVKSLFNHYNFV